MEFWQAYEIAFSMAEQHPDYDLIEVQRMLIIDQTMMSQYEKTLLTRAISEKYLLAMRLMFDFLNQ